MRKSKRSPFSKRLIQVVLLLAVLAVYRTCFYFPQSSDVYNRRDYRHWIDEDKNSLDTRQEVLIQESLIPATMSKDGRRAVAGLWVDTYTGNTNAPMLKIGWKSKQNGAWPLSQKPCKCGVTALVKNLTGIRRHNLFKSP